MTTSGRTWIWLHRWIGLLLGFVMALIGLSGSTIVLFREIDVALNPKLHSVEAGAPPHSATEILGVAQAALGGPDVYLKAPDSISPAWAANRRIEGRLWGASIDPSGTVLGVRDVDASVYWTLYKFHRDLLLRDLWGSETVGVLGIVLLFSAGSGLYLWWPKDEFWKALFALRVRPRQRLYLDIHNFAGVWTAVVMLVVAFSGVVLIFPGLVRPAVNLASPVTPAPNLRLPDRPEPYRVDLDRAVAIAEAQVSGAVLSVVQPPVSPWNVWRVGLRWPSADLANRGGPVVWIDPWTGDVLAELPREAATAGDAFMHAQLWLHNGSLLGWPGRLAVFLSGLALPALFVTGMLLWLRRRAARRALRKRRDAAVYDGATADPIQR